MGPAVAPSLTPRRPWLEWTLVTLAAVCLAGVVTWAGDADLRGDQHAYNLLVARLLDPAVLARDALYRHDPDQLHVPWFLHLHAALARRLDGDVERALAWLTWPMGVLYLVAHYALFRAVSGSATAAGLAAVGALTVRHALGGDLWGFDGVRSAATRSILAGLVPLLLLFVAWRSRRGFPVFFLLLGALFNVHPVTAYQLAEGTALAHVALARLQPRAVGQVLAGIALFCVGAAPYLVPFLGARDSATDAATLTAARQALDYRFAYLLYPQTVNAVASVAFHAALPVLAWLTWRRRVPERLRRPLEAFAIAAIVAGLLGTAASQAVGLWRDRPYPDIQQLRALRLAYPVLLCGLAAGYATLLACRSPRALAAVAALFVASLVPPHEVIHAVSPERREAVKAWLGATSPKRVAAASSRAALAAWAVASTPPDALFFTDDFEFRVRTRRAITGSFKDGALFFLLGDRPFVAWYRATREVEACRARHGRDCWFALARRAEADYALVGPGLTEAGTPPDFDKVFEGGGWSAWRRRSA